MNLDSKLVGSVPSFYGSGCQ